MSNLNRKPVIDLFEFDSLGLIISFPSGVIYSNQVGGTGCLHPEIEGVFFPLSVRHKKILFALQQHFKGDWHRIENSDADIIDKLLRSDEFDFIKVDRSKLNKSFEAWIYVHIEPTSDLIPMLSGFGKTEGILTWENSD